MRPIDSSLIPEDGSLVLLTSRDIADDSRLMAADFRDMVALVYKPTGSYLGVNATGVHLGRMPLEMVNGIWLMKEDDDLRKSHQNIQLRPELLALEMIR